MFDRELMNNTMSAGEPREYDMWLIGLWFGSNEPNKKS